jgi:hypothetical protein
MNTAARNDQSVEAAQQNAPASAQQPDNGLSPEENALLHKQDEPAAGAQPGAAPGQQPDQQQAQQQPGQQPDPAQAGAAPAAGQQAAGSEEEDTIDDDGQPRLGPDGQPKPPPRRVNYNKYERMQKRAQKAEQDLKALGEEITQGKISQAKLEERIALINEALLGRQGAAAQQQQQQNDDPEPDPNEIFEHTAWMRRQLAKTQQTLQQVMQGQQAETEDMRLVGTYQNDAATFAQQQPMFPAAYQFLLASRAVELGQLMFGKDFTTTQPTVKEMEELQDALANEERGLVAMAIKQGRSPSAALFSLARGRGFDQWVAAQQQRQQQGQQQQQPQQNGQHPPQQNGQHPPAQQQRAPGIQPSQNGGAPSVTERLATLKSGMEAAQSLSNGVGVGSTAITPQSLAAMPDADFHALLDRMTPAQQKQALGGA